MSNFIKDLVCNVDTNHPFFHVRVFKQSGKWVSEKYTEINDEMLALINNHETYEIQEMMQRNDKKIRVYSPLQGGFVPSYIYVVTSYRTEGFCAFLLTVRESLGFMP